MAAGIYPDEPVYGSLIAASANAGQVEDAVRWFDTMEDASIRPGAISYNSVLHACAKAGRSKDAIVWLRRMDKDKVQPNVISYTSAITACAASSGGTGDLLQAEQLFCQMLARRIRPDRRLLQLVARVFGDRRVGILLSAPQASGSHGPAEGWQIKAKGCFRARTRGR